MSTLEATVSMLEMMPEEARILVLEYTQKLFSSPRPANPFTPMSEEQVLSVLAESRQEISDGKGIGMDSALQSLGEKYGFIFHQRQDYENTFTQDLETDPFFNPSNQAFIENSIKELREGKGTPHELIEEDVIHKSEQNNIAVYPKATISELQKEVSKIKTDIKNGKQPVFDKPASLIDALEK